MGGPTRNFFGDLVRSALEPVDTEQEARAEIFEFKSLEIGQIQAVYAVDNPQNNPDGRPGTHTLYDVIIYRTNGATEKLPRCRMMQPSFGGSINNFFESTTPTPKKSVGLNQAPTLSPGAMVIVACLGGRRNNGIILGTYPSESPIAVSRRPKQSEGTVTKGEIQGLYFEVNNDGELTVTFNGPRDDSGNLIGNKGPTTLKLDKNGNFEVTTNASQSVKIEPATKTVTVDSETIYAKDKKGGTLKISGGKVGLGTQANELLDLFDQFLEEVQKEEHVCSQAGLLGSTPINKGKYAAIQQKLKKIKGGV